MDHSLYWQKLEVSAAVLFGTNYISSAIFFLGRK